MWIQLQGNVTKLKAISRADFERSFGAKSYSSHCLYKLRNDKFLLLTCFELHSATEIWLSACKTNKSILAAKRSKSLRFISGPQIFKVLARKRLRYWCPLSLLYIQENLLAALAIFLSKNIPKPLKSRKISYNVKETYSPLVADIRTAAQLGKMSAATAKQTNNDF